MGVSGVSGAKGLSGVNGLSGVSGFIGVIGLNRASGPTGCIPSNHATGFPDLSTNVPLTNPPHQFVSSLKKYSLFVNPIQSRSLEKTMLPFSS